MSTRTKHRALPFMVLPVLALVQVSGCQHSQPSQTTNAEQIGVYVNVAGLPYTVQNADGSTISGVTGSLGEFRYMLAIDQGDFTVSTPRNLAFYLMKDVKVPGDGPVPRMPWLAGSAQDPAVQLPDERVDILYESPFTASTDSVQQHNVMMALEMIDQDGDPSNGIQIPSAVASASLGSSVNWSAANPRTDSGFLALQAAVQKLDPSGAHLWPADDATPTADFTSVWTCALSGSYDGYLKLAPQPGGANPGQGNDSGFLADYYAFIMPAGAVGSSAIGDPLDSSLQGVFRLSGGHSLLLGAPVPPPQLQIGMLGSQYQSADEFAPPSNPQMAYSLDLYIDNHSVTGSWGAGGDQGSVDQASSRRHDPAIVINSKRHPLVPKWKFQYYPIWVHDELHNQTVPYVMHVEIGTWYEDGIEHDDTAVGYMANGSHPGYEDPAYGPVSNNYFNLDWFAQNFADAASANTTAGTTGFNIAGSVNPDHTFTGLATVYLNSSQTPSTQTVSTPLSNSNGQQVFSYANGTQVAVCSVFGK